MEKDLTKKFIDYLISIGYPKESIVVEYPVDARYSIDIAIIDPKTNLLVQIFELKNTFSGKIQETARKQLETYLSKLERKVPAYIVFQGDDSQPFKILDYKDKDEDTFVDLIDYTYILNKAITANNQTIATRRKRKIDRFQWICWGWVVVLIFVIVCQKLCIFEFEFSWIDLSVIGVAVVLTILPFFSKISFNGLEMIRNNTENI
jgi:hypothetical protein